MARPLELRACRVRVRLARSSALRAAETARALGRVSAAGCSRRTEPDTIHNPVVPRGTGLVSFQNHLPVR